MFETLEVVARRLDGAGIPWAVFAGAAAAVHGAERPITDIDIIVAEVQGERVAELFPEADLSRDEEGDLGEIVLPGIDIVPGLGFADLDREMEAYVERHEIGGVDVPVIGVEDNILIKAMTGRGPEEGKRDWADVEEMLEAARDLDWSYMQWRAGIFPDQARAAEVMERIEALR
jgi:hypothetical protein